MLFPQLGSLGQGYTYRLGATCWVDTNLLALPTSGVACAPHPGVWHTERVLECDRPDHRTRNLHSVASFEPEPTAWVLCDLSSAGYMHAARVHGRHQTSGVFIQGLASQLTACKRQYSDPGPTYTYASGPASIIVPEGTSRNAWRCPLSLCAICGRRVAHMHARFAPVVTPAQEQPFHTFCCEQHAGFACRHQHVRWCTVRMRRPHA